MKISKQAKQLSETLGLSPADAVIMELKAKNYFIAQALMISLTLTSGMEVILIGLVAILS